MNAVIAAGVALLFCPPIAAAQPVPDTGADTVRAKRYTECMSLARSAPDRAIGEAAKWEREGGDEGARHCAAVALLNTGAYAEAAERFQALATTTQSADKMLKGELFAQAGQAWLISGDAEKALVMQNRAIAAAGPGRELLIDRAITLASLARYWEAIDDLSRAIDQDPERPDVLVLRATAWRKLENLDLALDDIQRALGLKPGAPDALLERGIIQRLKGDKRAARADWELLIDRHPKSPAAEDARRNLDRLNAN